MRARMVAASFLLAAGFSPAAAQDIGGRYSSEGIDPAGGKFSLTAEITMVYDNACRLRWSDGTDAICMLNGNSLSVAYLIHGKLGLGVYELSSDGSLDGPIIDDFHGGGTGKGGKIGREKLTPVRQ